MNQTKIPSEIEKQISYVSHEIRNNISICDMYSQIIKKNLEISGIKNTSLENAVDCIQKSIQIISANLLDLKSINSENLKIYDLKQIVEKGIVLSKGYLQNKDIEFCTKLQKDIKIKVDENRYLSCIINIIKNAVEAIEISGKIKIYTSANDNYAILKISNNGTPIPENVKENIFNDRFTTKETGSGFGLCICKKYLREQCSDLKLIKSDINETVFEIITPLASGY